MKEEDKQYLSQVGMYLADLFYNQNNMKQIPTAEEVIDKMVKFASVNDTINCTVYSLSQVMIEFAKLHVEAAIKACIEEAPSGSSTDTVSYEDVVEALKDCYPLENIK